jgi:hypothetical protein
VLELDEESPPRQRLRFEELTHEAAPDGQCHIGVRLEWCGRTMEGSATNLETHQGRIRASAEAALRAAAAATERRASFDLVGVKSVRAFDGWVVVARINSEADGRTYRLLGSASCEDEEKLSHTAAIAVLDATNRVLSRYVTAPPASGEEPTRLPPRE